MQFHVNKVYCLHQEQIVEARRQMLGCWLLCAEGVLRRVLASWDEAVAAVGALPRFAGGLVR